jgi:hypothetical protein
MRALGSLCLTVGLLLLGLALAAFLDSGGGRSRLIAYAATVIGLPPVAWGLLLRWHRRAWVAFVAAGLALISTAMVAPGLIGDDQLTCLVIAAIDVATAILGVLLGRYRLRSSV